MPQNQANQQYNLTGRPIPQQPIAHANAQQRPQNQIPSEIQQLRDLSKPKRKWYENKKILLIGGGIVSLLLIIGVVFSLLNTQRQAPTPQVKTISFWTRDIDEEVVNQIIADFEKENPFIKVKFEVQSDTDYENRMKTRLKLKSTNMGNIVEIEESWIEDVFLSLTVLNNPTITSRYSNASIKNNSYQNAIFAIPFSFDSLTLAYNVGHIQEIGYNEETFNKLDWTFLSSRVKTLTKTQKATLPPPTIQQYDQITRSGIALGSPKNITNSPEIIQLLLIQNEAKIYDSKSKQFLLDPKFIDVMEFYTNFTPSNVWREYMGNDIQAFTQGKTSMILVRSKDIDMIRKMNPSLKFYTTTPAKIAGIQTISLSKSLAIPNYMPNYAESVKFLEYFTKVENGTKLFNSENGPNTFIPAQLQSLNQIPKSSPFAVYSDLNATAEKFDVPYYSETTLLLESYLIETYDSYYRQYPLPNATQPFKIDSGRLQSDLNTMLKSKQQSQ